MTNETAKARAEHFSGLAAELFFDAEIARRARCYGDAAELTARATRASGTAAAYRRVASRAAA